MFRLTYDVLKSQKDHFCHLYLVAKCVTYACKDNNLSVIVIPILLLGWWWDDDDVDYNNDDDAGDIVCQGAVVCPSDEDSQTFTVNAANGESYRLKGKLMSTTTMYIVVYFALAMSF